MAPVASSVASYRVTLQPSGHSFITDGSDPILQAALDAGLTLPYGCRNGACGASAARRDAIAGSASCARPASMPKTGCRWSGCTNNCR